MHRVPGGTVGYLLFLIAAGELVFVVFTDKQRAYRNLFLVTSATAFAFGQVFLDPEFASYHFTDHVQAVLFSVNAMGTGMILFILAALTYQRARVAQEQAHASAARAEYLANTDPLTGLANRRPLAAELERVAVPGGPPYCVAIADLDWFKELNDTFGHACGDRVLATLGRMLRSRVRMTDLVGRWGGEEFIFVLPLTTLHEAEVLVERIRGELAGLVVDCTHHVHVVTASFGIADGGGETTASRVLRRADDAMYDAKRAGRNTVRVRAYAGSGPIPMPDESAVTPPSRALRVKGE